MKRVNKEITNYVEAEILPKYNKLGGHTDKHIRQVIERSLRFYQQEPNLNIDMVYVIAAYHDLGRLINNETHNIESAKIEASTSFNLARLAGFASLDSNPQLKNALWRQ